MKKSPLLSKKHLKCFFPLYFITRFYDLLVATCWSILPYYTVFHWARHWLLKDNRGRAVDTMSSGSIGLLWFVPVTAGHCIYKSYPSCSSRAYSVPNEKQYNKLGVPYIQLPNTILFWLHLESKQNFISVFSKEWVLAFWWKKPELPWGTTNLGRVTTTLSHQGSKNPLVRS